MATQHRRLPALAALAILLCAPTAFAQYGIQAVQATPVLVFVDQIPASVPVSYETEILTSGGDTVIHVLEDAPPFRPIAASDDCRRHGRGDRPDDDDDDREHHHGDRMHDEGRHGEHGGRNFGHHNGGAATKHGLASCLTMSLPVATRVRVLVRAERNNSRGFANLLRNGVQVVSNFPFAGTQVKATWMANDVFETPLASFSKFPGAATDTQLLLIRDPPPGLVAYDDDDGVGLASRLSAPSASNGLPLSSPSSSLIVVASTSATAAGPARLVQNDVLHADADHDGLGDKLETFADPAGYLPTLPSAPDSDGDGINDGFELLGKDGTHPQLLSRWGATPRHRDLFIEVDRDHSSPSQGVTLSRAHAQALAARLALWPNAELHNLDARDGVALHVDLGTNGPSDVFGDFGGSNDVLATHDLQQAYAANLVHERAGLFVYAFARFGCEEVAHLASRRVVFASTCGDFAWKNLAYNLSQNLKWGTSCCAYRHL